MKTLALLVIPAVPAFASMGQELDVDVSALEQRVDTLLEAWDGARPGGAVAVLLHGETLLLRTFGQARPAGDAVESDTPFYIASLAKPFVAAGVVRAANAGLLDLERSVRALFPELPARFEAVTLRHCLHHTSGLPDVYDAAIALDLGRDAVSSNAAALELLARLPGPGFTPGTRFAYSNSGYVLLYEALERATERSLADDMERELFGPAGMDDALWLDGALPRAAAVPGRPAAGGSWEPTDFATGMRGPGGLCLSLDDLIAFERAWYDGEWGGRADLRAAVLEAPAASEHPLVGRYAAGWMLGETLGHASERHFGGAFGAGADLLRFPALGLSVLVLCNAADLSPTDLGEELARAALGPLARRDSGAVPAAAPTLDTSTWAGLWIEADNHVPWILISRGDGMRVVSLADLSLDLVPDSAGLAAPAPGRLRLRPGKDGGLLVEFSAQLTLGLSRPTPGDAPPTAECAGRYSGPAGSVTFALEGTALRLVQERPILSLPVFRSSDASTGVYLCDAGAAAHFARDTDGRVTLELSVNRAWGLRFTREDED